MFNLKPSCFLIAAEASGPQHDLSAAVRAMAVTALLQVRAKELELKGANPWR